MSSPNLSAFADETDAKEQDLESIINYDMMIYSTLLHNLFEGPEEKRASVSLNMTLLREHLRRFSQMVAKISKANAKGKPVNRIGVSYRAGFMLGLLNGASGAYQAAKFLPKKRLASPEFLYELLPVIVFGALRANPSSTLNAPANRLNIDLRATTLPVRVHAASKIYEAIRGCVTKDHLVDAGQILPVTLQAIKDHVPAPIQQDVSALVETFVDEFTKPKRARWALFQTGALQGGVGLQSMPETLDGTLVSAFAELFLREVVASRIKAITPTSFLALIPNWSVTLLEALNAPNSSHIEGLEPKEAKRAIKNMTPCSNGVVFESLLRDLA